MPEQFIDAERRSCPRGTLDGGPPRGQIIDRIVREYRQMPGLSLNVSQASRLFGMGRTTCQSVLDDLVRGGQLHVRDGQYRNRGL